MPFYLLIINIRHDLWRHMKFEETCILPLYDKYVDSNPTPGKPEHFHMDHDLIRQYIDDLSGLLLRAAFEPVPPAMLRHDTVRLDTLLEHHDERETGYLYPALQGALNRHASDVILEQMWSFRIVGLDKVTNRSGLKTAELNHPYGIDHQQVTAAASFHICRLASIRQVQQFMKILLHLPIQR